MRTFAFTLMMSLGAFASPLEKQSTSPLPSPSNPTCGQRGAKACERRLMAPLKSDEGEKTRVPDTARRDEARGGVMI